ncbi:MAG: RNase adapter RapZ [Gammaproteobacteria bacterium CG22_combo_CG10-13_8_21_14_all_40_8]|nr:MAG: RNase adapter RapZ [Gammaproteobacteria bacterium CG22_combo_CG10-13_8_21_14_all_40_8]
MKLIFITGRSGSGKSLALRTVEDLGFYCVDNLPNTLILDFLKQIGQQYKDVAVGLDARSINTPLTNFRELIDQITKMQWKVEVLFIDANNETLLKRFSETRRRHPLTHHGMSLQEAINQERLLLEPLALSADLTIDTSHLTPNQFRKQLAERLLGQIHQGMDLLFLSFGYKNSIPADANFVFDARCLPNPYWDESLRQFNGKDPQIIEFLSAQPAILEFIWQVKTFLHTWLPRFEAENRSYMTIAIGCTGGQHRSVYLAEQLEKHFKQTFKKVRVQHRELDKTS